MQRKTCFHWHLVYQNNMKLIFSVSITIVTVLASCGTAKESVVEPMISNVVTGSIAKINYNSERTDSVNCAITYNYFAPNDAAYKDSINRKIKDYVIRITQFGGKPGTNSILSNTFFQAQLDSFVLINEMERADYDDGLNQMWEIESVIEIDDSFEQFAQLQLTAWAYTGGAHGNGATKTELIEKSKGKVLTIDAVFTDVSAVTAIAETYFRKMYELEPDADLDDAGFWFENNLFHLNNNFFISGDVIAFLYNSYEIAPYSGGQTLIEIPLEEVKNYLKIKF